MSIFQCHFNLPIAMSFLWGCNPCVPGPQQLRILTHNTLWVFYPITMMSIFQCHFNLPIAMSFLWACNPCVHGPQQLYWLTAHFIGHVHTIPTFNSMPSLLQHSSWTRRLFLMTGVFCSSFIVSEQMVLLDCCRDGSIYCSLVRQGIHTWTWENAVWKQWIEQWKHASQSCVSKINANPKTFCVWQSYVHFPVILMQYPRATQDNLGVQPSLVSTHRRRWVCVLVNLFGACSFDMCHSPMWQVVLTWKLSQSDARKLGQGVTTKKWLIVTC